MTASPGPSGSPDPATDEGPTGPLPGDPPGPPPADVPADLPTDLVESLALATEQLRTRPLPRVVEVADSVLRRSLAAVRPSVLVRGRPPYDFVRVSSTAISAVVRERVDARLQGAAVSRILLDVDREQNLRILTLELFVQYGVEILAIADESRRLAREALAGLLGEETADGLTVAVHHVHVSDVTLGDPHLVDPGDE